MKKVLVIDPGERVGWCTAEVAEGTLTKPGIKPIERGVTPLKDFALKLNDVFSDYDVVVFETWRLRPDVAKKLVGNEFLPSQLIGIIRFLGWLNRKVKLVPLAPQQKQMHEGTIPKYLRNWYKDSSEEHDKDAVQLLWAYYFREWL